MRRGHVGLVLTLSAVGLHVVFLRNAWAQAEATQPGVVLTKLCPPILSHFARRVNVAGEVQVQVEVRKDGSVASAELVSGHPILKQFALESAQNSHFECQRCTEAVTPYLLTYTFEIKDDGSCCDSQSRAPEITQRQGHITIVSAKNCICDPSFTLAKKVRSAKCLYLWKCGVSRQ